jgi:hypothetical protein
MVLLGEFDPVMFGFRESIASHHGNFTIQQIGTLSTRNKFAYNHSQATGH